MPAEEATPAIVLRVRDYLESDRIVTLLTRESGKLGGIAKGAKKSRRRFERKLEVFSHVMLYFRRRPHGELVFITRAEAGGLPPLDLADDLGKIALGCYMVDLADALTREEADAAGAYHLLAETLTVLSRRGAGESLRQSFELKMLKWAGYELEFSRCRSCLSEVALDGASVAFAPSRGGVVCRSCHERLKDAYPTLRLSRGAAAALARLSAAPSVEAAAMEPAGRDATLAISRFIGGVVDRRLRSLSFLDSML